MGIDENDIDRFKKDNEDKINRAAQQAKAALGKDGEAIDSMLKDKNRLNQLLKLVSKDDFDKISSALDDPQLVNKILANPKARENLKKILGEK